MKSIYSKVCAITLLLVSLFIFTSRGYPQVKKVGGIYYPQNYLVTNSQNHLNLKKTSYDTLSYSTFKKTINDFDVIKGCGSFGSDQTNVNIARSNDGGYMCVWEDHSSGYIEIVGQLFSANDEKISGELKISDQFCHWNSEPHIAYSPVNGEYIITWANSGYDILIQRVSKSGSKIGNNVNVAKVASTNTNNPSAAINNSGDILITWYSDC